MGTNHIKSRDLCEVCLWHELCRNIKSCKDCENFNKEIEKCKCLEIRLNTPCDIFIENPSYFK